MYQLVRFFFFFFFWKLENLTNSYTIFFFILWLIYQQADFANNVCGTSQIRHQIQKHRNYCYKDGNVTLH